MTNERFLISNSNEVKSGCVFSSRDQLICLSESSSWFSDGTFKSSPREFLQNYIIHGCYQNKSTLPCVFSFLPDKSRQTYRHMFNCMKLAGEEYKIELKPKKVFVDFEAAAINEFKLAWPSAEIKGCFFHFAKAILRKAVVLGLKQQYEKNEKDFQKWLKFFMGFAFLPLDELDEAFEVLKTEAPDLPKIDELIEYLESTWIGESALFDRIIWNHWRSKNARTTNICEGYNNRMNHQTSGSNPSLFKARIRVSEDNSTATSSSKIYASQIDSTSTYHSKPLFKMPYDPKAWPFRSFPLNNYDVDASSLDTL